MKSLSLQILVFALTRTVVNTLHRMVYPFLAVFARGLGVPLPLMGLAMTARATLGIFAPVLAGIADSRGRKTGMLLGLSLFILGMGLVALHPSYATFMGALLLAVVGKYVFDPSMQAYLGDLVHYNRRGLVIAVTEFGWSISFIAGVPLAGLLIAHYGWTAPFPVLGLAVLTLLLLLWHMLPADPAPQAGKASLWSNYRAVLVSKQAVAGLVMGIMMSSANEMVNLVFGLWMEDSFSMKIAALAGASAVIGLSELGGEGLTAVIADRLGKTRSVGAGLALNCLAALALPFLGLSVPGALAGLFLFYISFEFTMVTTISLMTELLPGARASLMSANVAGFSLGRALGALLGGPIYTLGIFASCLAAIAFNLGSAAALRQLSRHASGIPGPAE